MAKHVGDLAYIEDEQCNDRPRTVALVPVPPVLLPRALVRREPAPEVRYAIAMTADASWVHPDSLRAKPPRSPWVRGLEKCIDAALALLTFAVQVAAVAFVIVLIARFGLR